MSLFNGPGLRELAQSLRDNAHRHTHGNLWYGGRCCFVGQACNYGLHYDQDAHTTGVSFNAMQRSVMLHTTNVTKLIMEHELVQALAPEEQDRMTAYHWVGLNYGIPSLTVKSLVWINDSRDGVSALPKHGVQWADAIRLLLDDAEITEADWELPRFELIAKIIDHFADVAFQREAELQPLIAEVVMLGEIAAHVDTVTREIERELQYA